MTVVKSFGNNFESMSDTSKKDVLLYVDSCFDENKNKLKEKCTTKEKIN